MRPSQIKLGVLAATVLAVAGAAIAATPAESAASGVLQRLLGRKADAFVLKEIAADNGLDVYELEARDGKVYVSGSSGVALCRGAYQYLKDACHGLMTWEGSHIDLPDTLPDFPKLRVVCPHKYRHYFNVCTFGYSMVWWDWKRWEREIDWMALHGINMPLAMNGQEAIWRKVWQSYGLTDKDLEPYFTGPAFLPWHRMGNVNGHAGPLPVSWMEAQAELQKKILARERELGMTPVTPGFSGFVPPAFAQAHPQASIRKSSVWGGFEPSLTLDPKDPLFTEIGSRFVREYRREFGTDPAHLYLCDTFNEMTPQTDPQTKLDYLTDIGEAVYKSVLAGDPDGTWVMMGWLFMDGGFWDEPAKKALFSRVPVDKFIVLDLGVDVYQISFDSAEFRNRQWIYCWLTNFGQNTTTSGILQAYATAPFKTRSDPARRGRMVGMGITPEGVEQNPINYELITDTMWQDKPVELSSWLRSYCEDRYGSCPPEMAEAWDLLMQTLYNIKFARRPVYAMRPILGLRVSEIDYDTAKVQRAIKLFLDCSDRLGASDLYRRDLVDLVKQYVADGMTRLTTPITSSYVDGDHAALKKASDNYIGVMQDIDRLLATRPEYHLSRWIDSARAWGNTPAEKAFYEMNARMQITVWGPADLFDYAWKDWTGLITDFYVPRWQRLLDKLAASDSTKPFDANWWKSAVDWELAWCKSSTPISELEGGDAVKIARELYGKYGAWPDKWPKNSLGPGIAVGKPVTVSGGTMGDHRPERAVDGNSEDWDGSRWSAVPAPQWLKLDLQKLTKIDRVQVWNYWNWSLIDYYTVEISADGTDWTMVADMSKNTRIATSLGHLHKFAPTDVRYVRVTCLGDNTSRHVFLVEVRVYEAGK